MSKPLRLVVCLVAVSVAATAIWWPSHRQHAEYQHRYQALAAAIPLHTTRQAAEQLLQQKHLDYSREWGPGSVAMDDLVRLSPEKYLHSVPCGRQSPSVLIRFAASASEKQTRALSAKPPRANPVYPSSGQPNDEVTGLSYELICEDDI